MLLSTLRTPLEQTSLVGLPLIALGGPLLLGPNPLIPSHAHNTLKPFLLLLPYLATIFGGEQHFRLFVDSYIGTGPLLGPTPSCEGKQPVSRGLLSGKLLVPHDMSSKPLTRATSLVKTVGLGAFVVTRPLVGQPLLLPASVEWTFLGAIP